jgi:NAD(P)-dependent dehydrogenase (short-subunit alcohol dehydrogenase family)
MDPKTFLISGASKGIGRATAERLAAGGHRVVGLARGEPAGRFPGAFVAVDLADPAATARAVERVCGEHQIDGVVNNVGVVRPALLGAVDLSDLAAVFDLNLRPAVQLTQAALPGMRERRWGRVVNVSSLTVLGVPGRTAYAAAKAALVSFTRTWVMELAAAGVTVNAVAPGPTETELFRQNNPPGSPGERAYLAGVPLGRLGRPDEVAAAITFFLGEDAGWVTGQTLFVDGGSSVGRTGV